MNYELLTKQVANLSRAMGSFFKSEIKNLKTSDIESKGFNNFVTHVDKKSEERIIKELAKILPEAGVIAEEDSNLKKAGEYNWIIDPLDGTTNFIHGVPLYSTSIALIKGDKIVSGVVYEVNLQECFYAWKDGGAYLNEHKISVSHNTKLKDSLLATGFPYDDFERMEQYIEALKYFMKSTHGVRRLGSAAVDLAYVAAGRYDGFWEYGLNSWDVAAGSIIVHEAGGIVRDFNGENNYIFGKEIIASNSYIYEEFLNSLSKHFNG